MDIGQVTRGLLNTDRRHALAGLLAGVAAPMLAVSQGSEARKKKHKKKCKKGPAVDRCPQRYCCKCDDDSCHLVEASGPLSQVCAAFCADLGLMVTSAHGSLEDTNVVMCATVGPNPVETCVRVVCPIV